MLCLAEIELIFPKAAFTALCFALVAGKMLVKPVFWLLQSLQHSTLTRNLSMGEMLGGHITKTADPKWPKGYSMLFDVFNKNSKNNGGKRMGERVI